MTQGDREAGGTDRTVTVTQHKQLESCETTCSGSSQGSPGTLSVHTCHECPLLSTRNTEELRETEAASVFTSLLTKIFPPTPGNGSCLRTRV